MKNIVTVGGGTGSYTILSGLKNLENISLTALVSMADDGGSSGVLRVELGVLPPGDVRQCLVALSEDTEILLKLMNYRFTKGKFSGDNFGNIFLAALEKVTGDFAKGVEEASKILKVAGRVIPITKNKAELVIKFTDKTIIEGESNIDKTDIREKEIEKIFYKNIVKLNPRARDAIIKADYIILGPGNFYCSIIPNLIVKGFRETICASRARIILPVNLTNKEGHTNNWKVSSYVNKIEKYLGRKVDFVLINDEKPTEKQLKYYRKEIQGDVLVLDDFSDRRVIREPLLSHAFVATSKVDTVQRSFIRHDSKKLAKCVEKIIKN